MDRMAAGLRRAGPIPAVIAGQAVLLAALGVVLDRGLWPTDNPVVKPVPYDLESGIGTGKGVTLLPELSVILATPSFSTSSMRITACMGMKLR